MVDGYTLEENPMCLETYVSFRLAGDTLDPDLVTQKLGIEPSAKGRKGEVRSENPITGQHALYRTGIWLLCTKGILESTSIERHILYLLDRLEPVAEEIRRLREDYALSADLFAYWLSAHGHGGPVFSPGVLRRIADMDLSLGIDFYAGSADAE